ncbi:sensor histidine kinase [Candidatus Roseilinea sp. NK_OTU-006]|jgi:signal transduction histidine kinase|nr:sensor histidine kinase [Candidatus Roseilinea sp. NK_OTU-006]
MKTNHAPFGVPALLAMSALLGLLAFWVSLGDLGRPFPGFLLIRDPSGTQWYIAQDTPSWWPGLRTGELLYADRVLAIDGHPLVPGLNYMALYAQAYARGAREITLRVARDGHVFDARAPIVLYTPAMLLDLTLPTVLVRLCVWLLAVLVYIANPAAPLNRAVSALGALIVVVIGTFFSGVNFDATGWPNRLMDVGWLAATSFLGLSIWQATMWFTAAPSERPAWRVLRAGQIVLLAGGVIALSPYLIAKVLWWTAGWSPMVGTLETIDFAMLNVCVFGAGFFALLRIAWTAWRATSPRRRRQSQILMIGFAFSLPPMIFQVNANITQAGAWFLSGPFDLRYLYLALPLALAFAVLRYQMLRSVHPLLLVVLALMGSGLVADVAQWALRVSGNIPPDADPGVSAVLIIIVITLGVGAVSVLLPRWAAWFFNWEGQRYMAVQQFLNRVMPRAEPATLPSEIAAALVAELQVEKAALWLLDAQGMLRLAAIARHTQAEAAEPPALLQPPAGALTVMPGVVMFLDHQRAPAWLAPLGQAGFVVVALLAAQGEALGLMGLGLRWDEETFHRRDVEIVALIALQVSLFLLNARRIEALREVPRRISEAQERERLRIAQELHDTVQQFLGRLPFHLELSRRDIRANPAAAEARLERCIADVEQAARVARQIRSNLAPTQLVNSLAGPLADLAERFRARAGAHVSVEIAPAVDDLLDVEARHALFRVAQQALDNVEAHAGASAVRVLAQPADHGVQLIIADNGRGFAPEDQARAVSEGHFGLPSMRARVESFGGRLTIDSAPGQGTRVVAWLPAPRP